MPIFKLTMPEKKQVFQNQSLRRDTDLWEYDEMVTKRDREKGGGRENKPHHTTNTQQFNSPQSIIRVNRSTHHQ